ncbi:MAG: helix-turn-helix transcriptional regulator [Clostridia bacterium]|nr:helix-turn-helix transcriptional regulator [Clostridia bacterium]
MEDREYISFSELCALDFDITDIFAMRQKWQKGALFHMDHPRKSSAVIYLNGCEGVYYTSLGQTVNAQRKSLLCLPARSEYKCLNGECGSEFPDVYLVEFNVVKDGKILTFGRSPFIIDSVNSYVIADICVEIIKNYEASVRSYPALKASVYKLLAYIGREETLSRGKRFDSIATGIELLEADVMNESSIDEIAKMCGVSSGCFRRLFKEYSGITPGEYRMRVKLDKAKQMLLGSNAGIERIAEDVGFESSAYFCRIFKKKSGMTPSEYRKFNT